MKGKYYVIWCKIRAFLPIRRWCGLICICGLIAACDNAGEGDGIKKQYDLEGKPIVITSYVHEKQTNLRAACREHFDENNTVEGGCMKLSLMSSGQWQCEVHLPKIRSVQDNTRINTWGHEYMHCVYGLWHK